MIEFDYRKESREMISTLSNISGKTQRLHTIRLTPVMGPASDMNAVVSPDLHVRGIQNLRVADASVMPVIVRGNTNAPAKIVDEKASALITEGRR